MPNQVQLRSKSLRKEDREQSSPASKTRSRSRLLCKLCFCVIKNALSVRIPNASTFPKQTKQEVFLSALTYTYHNSTNEYNQDELVIVLLLLLLIREGIRQVYHSM